MMMKIIFVLAAICVCSFAAKLKPCKNNKDCGDDACCVNNGRWLIVSKKEIIGGRVMPGIDLKAGKCVNYIAKGSSCHMQGFTSCGCTPGTKCVYYPDTTPLPKLSKRKIIYRPGNSFCEA
ncbi:uncharacterized protein [Watersipora subatra]|uniref:uncharacterized protein n=1 Tax=Watersipora subatra TaxID=2589382 RepID=UPI00355AEC98